MIYCYCYRPDTGDRKGVWHVDMLLSFVLSILAGVIAYYLCKWLDGEE